MTILVVDDDADLRSGLRALLEARGLEVVEAATIRQADVLAQLYEPATLLVDGILPDGNGVEWISMLRSEGREARGFDVQPHRDDEERADARALPLDDASVDFVFMDPPYSTHLDYSDEGECIGKLDAFEPGYLEAMERVFDEAWRVLRNRRYLAVYVSDTFKKKRGFVSLGAELYALLRPRWRPIDHVAVTRGNRKLEKPGFHRTAAEENFFLRGFNHLLIFKQE